MLKELKKRYKLKARKIISSLIAILLIFNQIGTAAVSIPQISTTEVKIPSTFQLTLPTDLGTVQSLLSGTGPTIIHLQTAHGNYEAQKKIQAILHYLKDAYGFKMLFLEGSVSKLDPGLLQFIPGDKQLTLEVAEELTKKALVKGSELFLLEEPAAEACGIENLKDYVSNGKAFEEVLTQQARSKAFLSDLNLQIERLSAAYLNKNLRNFLKRLDDFEAKKTVALLDWLSYLKTQAKDTLEVDLTNPRNQIEWPMLLRIFKLKEFETRIDLGSYQKEKESFLKAIRHIPQETYREIEKLLSLPLSQNQLPDPETGLLFEKMVSSLPASFNFDLYPNVKIFIGHLILQSELNPERLIGEMDSLAEKISQKLAKTNDEKKILVLLKDYRLLQRLFVLELTPEDYKNIIKEGEGVRPKNLIPHFLELNRAKRVKDIQFSHIEDIETLFSKANEFYVWAKKRDDSMIERLEARLKKNGQTKAIVITGGFHAAPFKEYFQNKGYNYALISPKITSSEGREVYIQSALKKGFGFLETSTLEDPFLSDPLFKRNAALNHLIKSEIMSHFQPPEKLIKFHRKQTFKRIVARSEMRAKARDDETEHKIEAQFAQAQAELFSGLSHLDLKSRQKAWQELKKWRRPGVRVEKEMRFDKLDDPDIFKEFHFAGSDEYESTVSSIILNGVQLFYRIRKDGHMFMDPMPGDLYLSKIYGPGYEKAGDGEGLLGYPDYFKNEDIIRLRSIKLADQISEIVGRPGLKVLEIGAGGGHVLEAGREKFGWEVEAVEQVPAFIKSIKNKKIPILEGKFEDADFGTKKFQAVIMRDVLEHVRDPEGFVKKVANLMNPGGIAYIKLPVTYPLHGPTYGYLQHLHHFSEASIRAMLNRAGFTVEQLTLDSNPAQSGLPAMDHMSLFARKTDEITGRSEMRMDESRRYRPKELEAFAAAIRKKVMDIWIAKKGPLSGALSIADLYAVFFMNIIDIQKYRTRDPGRMRIAPKGTSAYALYAAAAYAGLIDPKPMKKGDYSVYEPVPYGPMFGNVSIYKMGTQLDQSIGLALASKISGIHYPVAAFISDGELQIGIDHQAKFAAKHGLDNLAVIVDVNFLQSSRKITDVDHSLEADKRGHLKTLTNIWRSYGWTVVEIDGHNVREIEKAMARVGHGEKPLIIFAKTVKGKGVPFMEGMVDYNHRFKNESESVKAQEILNENLERYLQAGYSVDFPEFVFPDSAGELPRQYEIPKIKTNRAQLLETTLRDWIDKFMRVNGNSMVVIDTDNPKPWSKETPIRSVSETSSHVFAGVNERFALNLAAGLWRGGLIPLYVGPAAHMPVTAEDWKYLGLEGLPVTMISLAPGSELSNWGPGHLAYEDVRAFNTEGAKVYQPATVYDLISLLEEIYRSPSQHGPVYLRIPEMVGLDVGRDRYNQGEIGNRIRNNGFYVIDSNLSHDTNNDFAVIVTSGAITREALSAGKFLKKAGIRYKIVNVVNLSKVNSTEFQKEVRGSATILTAIDAHADSLASLVYRSLDNGKDRVVSRGVTDGGRYGSVREIYQHYKIDSAGIAETIIDRVNHAREKPIENASEFQSLLAEVLSSLDETFVLNRKSNLGLTVNEARAGLDVDAEHLSMDQWDSILKRNWYWSALTDENKRFVIENRIKPLARQLPLVRKQIERYVHQHFGPDVPVDIVSYRVNGSAIYGQFQKDKPGDLDGVVVVRGKGIRDIVPIPDPLEVVDGMLFDGFGIISTDQLRSNHPLALEMLTSAYGGGIPLIGPHAIEGDLSEHNRLLQARHNLIHGWDSIHEGKPVYRKWDIRVVEAKSILYQLGLIDKFDPMLHWRRVDQVKSWVEQNESGSEYAKLQLQNFVRDAEAEYEQLINIIQNRLDHLKEKARLKLIRQLLNGENEEAQLEILKKKAEEFRRVHQEQDFVSSGNRHYFGGWVGMFINAKNPNAPEAIHRKLIEIGDTTLIHRIAHVSHNPDILNAIFEASRGLKEETLRKGIWYALLKNKATSQKVRSKLPSLLRSEVRIADEKAELENSLTLGDEEELLAQFLGHGRFAKTGKRYEHALGDLLNHSSGLIATRAAWLVGELQLAEYRPALIEMVREGDDSKRLAAALALAKFPDVTEVAKEAVQKAIKKTSNDGDKFKLNIVLKKMQREGPLQRVPNLAGPTAVQSEEVLKDALFHGYATLINGRGDVVNDWQKIMEILSGTEIMTGIPHHLNNESLMNITAEALRSMREYFPDKKMGFIVLAHAVGGNGKVEFLSKIRDELAGHPKNENHYVLYISTGLKFGIDVDRPVDRIIRGKGRNERLLFELANYAQGSIQAVVQFDDDEARFKGEWVREMAAPLLRSPGDKPVDFVYPLQSRHWHGGRSTNNLYAPFMILQGYDVRSPIGGAYGYSRDFIKLALASKWDDAFYDWDLDSQFGAWVTGRRLNVVQVAQGYKDHSSFVNRLDDNVFSPSDPTYDYIGAGFEFVSDQIDIWRNLEAGDTVHPVEIRNLPLPAPSLIEYDVEKRFQIYREGFYAGFDGSKVIDGLSGDDRFAILKLTLEPKQYEAVETMVRTGELTMDNELWYHVLVGMLSAYHTLRGHEEAQRVVDVMRPLFMARIHYRMKLIENEKNRLVQAGSTDSEIEERLDELSEVNVRDLMQMFAVSRPQVAAKMEELKNDAVRKRGLLTIMQRAGLAPPHRLLSPREIENIVREALRERPVSNHLVLDSVAYPAMPEEWKWVQLKSFLLPDYIRYLNYAMRETTEQERNYALQTIKRVAEMDQLKPLTTNKIDGVMFNLIHRFSGQERPLDPLKEIWRNSAVKILSELWQSVEKKPDDESKLQRAVEIAANGNRIGFKEFLEAIKPDYKINFSELMNERVDLDINRIQILLKIFRTQGPKHFLYVMDNVPEDVADLILIRLLLDWGHRVTIIVHEKEAANDSTLHDMGTLMSNETVQSLFRSGGFETPHFISNGSEGRGTDLRFASEELKAAWGEQDRTIIISKGDSNHHLLAETTLDTIGLSIVKHNEGHPAGRSVGQAIIEISTLGSTIARKTKSILKKLVLERRELTDEENGILRQLLIKDPIQRETWGVNGSNVDSILQKRVSLLKKTASALADWWEKNPGGEFPWDTAWNIWFPEAFEILEAKQLKRPTEAYIYGITGHGGVGKSTHAAILKIILDRLIPEIWGSVEVVSLDDFYLPQNEREKLRNAGLDTGKGIPNRGLPGHYDTDWMIRFLHEVRNSEPSSIITAPIFSKGIDERLEKVKTIKGRVGVLIFEGWFVGAKTDVDPSKIASDHLLARKVATELPKFSEAFDAIDDLVAYRTPDLETIINDRFRQEELRRRLEPEKPGMTNEQIENYTRVVYTEGWDRKETSHTPPLDRVTYWANVDSQRQVVEWSKGGKGRKISGVPRSREKFQTEDKDKERAGNSRSEMRSLPQSLVKDLATQTKTSAEEIQSQLEQIPQTPEIPVSDPMDMLALATVYNDEPFMAISRLIDQGFFNHEDGFERLKELVKIFRDSYKSRTSMLGPFFSISQLANRGFFNAHGFEKLKALDQILQTTGTVVSFDAILSLADQGFFKAQGLESLKELAVIFRDISQVTGTSAPAAFHLISSLDDRGFFNTQGLERLKQVVPIFRDVSQATGTSAPEAFDVISELAHRGVFDQEDKLERLKELLGIFREIAQGTAGATPEAFHSISTLRAYDFFEIQGIERLKALERIFRKVVKATATAAPNAFGAISRLAAHQFFTTTRKLKRLEALVEIAQATGVATPSAFDAISKLPFSMELVPIFRNITQATGAAAPEAFAVIYRAAELGFFNTQGIERLKELAVIFRDITQVSTVNFLLALNEQGFEKLKEMASGFSSLTPGPFNQSILAQVIFHRADEKGLFKNLLLGSQQYAKLWILHQLDEKVPEKGILTRLENDLIPSPHILEAVSQGFPTMGIEAIREGGKRKITESIFLSNASMNVATTHHVGKSFVNEDGSVEIRILPAPYPILSLIVSEYIRLGILPQNYNYHTSIEGELEEEAFFFMMISFFMDIEASKLPPIVPGTAGHDFGFFDINSSYIGATVNAETGELQGTQTNINDKLVQNGRHVFQTDLPRKGILAAFAYAYRKFLKDPSSLTPEEAKMAETYRKIKEDFKDFILQFKLDERQQTALLHFFKARLPKKDSPLLPTYQKLLEILRKEVIELTRKDREILAGEATQDYFTSTEIPRKLNVNLISMPAFKFYLAMMNPNQHKAYQEWVDAQMKHLEGVYFEKNPLAGGLIQKSETGKGILSLAEELRKKTTDIKLIQQIYAMSNEEIDSRHFKTLASLLMGLNPNTGRDALLHLLDRAHPNSETHRFLLKLLDRYSARAEIRNLLRPEVRIVAEKITDQLLRERFRLQHGQEVFEAMTREFLGPAAFAPDQTGIQPVRVTLASRRINSMPTLASLFTTPSQTKRQLVDYRKEIPQHPAELDALILYSTYHPDVTYNLFFIASPEKLTSFRSELRRYVQSRYSIGVPSNFNMESVETVTALTPRLSQLFDRASKSQIRAAFITENPALAEIGYRPNLLRAIGSRDPVLQNATALLAGERLLEELPIDVLIRVYRGEDLDRGHVWDSLVANLRKLALLSSAA